MEDLVKKHGGEHAVWWVVVVVVVVVALIWVVATSSDGNDSLSDRPNIAQDSDTVSSTVSGTDDPEDIVADAVAEDLGVAGDVADAVPETTTAVNPLGGAYKNPFE